MNLIDLYEYAEQHGIDIDWFAMQRAESLSMPLGDDNYGIAINPKKVKTLSEEKCCVAHETGHCMTGSFYNRYSPYDVRKKHENQADKWAIHHLIPEDQLQDAVENGYTTVWELAEYFDVTENLMKKAICLYKNGNLAEI